MTPRLEIEPGPHWWEASALTTTPSLLSIFNLFDTRFSCFTPRWHGWQVIYLYINTGVLHEEPTMRHSLYLTQLSSRLGSFTSCKVLPKHFQDKQPWTGHLTFFSMLSGFVSLSSQFQCVIGYFFTSKVWRHYKDGVFADDSFSLSVCQTTLNFITVFNEYCYISQVVGAL